MKLILNGNEKEVQSEQVEALVVELGLPSRAALVEHNGIALLRSEWADQQLKPGDRLEIIRMVAGG